MGPLRGGLILSLFAGPAFAGVCDQLRPDWDGTSASAVSEAIYHFTSPTGLFLIAALAVAAAFRHKMGAAIVVLLWSFYISSITLPAPTGPGSEAAQSGCIGSPSLYIALSALLSVGVIVYVFKARRG